MCFLKTFARITVVAIFLAYSTIASAALTDNQVALLENLIINKTLNEQNVTGMSISVVQGDGFNDLFSMGYGYRDVENGLPATNQTLFGVGSLSKMISTLYIVKILNDKFPDRGEGVLDTPIRTLAPAFNFTLIDRYRSEYATFRDLLAHKVCLILATEVALLVGAFESKEDAVYRQRYCPEKCGFRHMGMHYNNLLLHVAAEVTGHIHGTGEAFEDLLEKFLVEMGMTDSRFIRVDDDFEAIPNMSKGYYMRNNENQAMNLELIKRSVVIPSAGALLTTSNDMANFMAILGTKGKRMDGTQVVGEHVIQWMSRNSNAYLKPAYKDVQADRPRGDTAYGLGLIVGTHDGFQRLRHLGYIAPYTTTMNVYPGLKLGIFTVTNGPSKLVNHDQIHDQLVDIVRGIITEPNAEYVPVDPENALSSHMPESFTDIFSQMIEYNVYPTLQNTIMLNHSDLIGNYGSAVGGYFEIADVNETTLYITYGTWGKGNLIQRIQTPAIYDAIFDTDLAQNWYAESVEVPEISLDFSTPKVAVLNLGGALLPFAKDFNLSDLPAQPYPDDSCGYLP